jgi:hypothetical protein
MVLFGTTVNAASIVAGGAVGLLLKKGIPDRLSQEMTQMCGLGIFLIGINGVVVSMIHADTATGTLSDSGGLLLVISLVLGGLIGELLRIDDRVNDLGQRIEVRLGAEGFARGFVSASLLFCIGAMAIVGALNDGLRGDSSVLLIKSALDAILAAVLASSLGFGVLFSAIPVFLYQGAIALGAQFLAPFLTDGLLEMICMVGYAIVLVIGTGQMGFFKVKTANLLPALLIPILYQLIHG